MADVGLLEFGSEEQMESIALRAEILRKPLGLVFSAEELQLEISEFHIGAMSNSQVVGVLLLKPLDKHHIKMRQVAVHTNFQKQGIGKQMVAFSEDFAKALDYQNMVLHARINAVPFYLSLGYQIDGDQFEEVGIAHHKMFKKL
jgi:N-acetylglutamate synthase-like GNAT family acetyltransferase